jgi:putative membrane protein
MRAAFVVALLAMACGGRTGASRDDARVLNANRGFAHNSQGDILGPSVVNQRVYGQRDAAGNVHVTTDRWFLIRAHELSWTQITLAQLALERAGSPEIKRMAWRISSEQQRLDERIRHLAQRRKIPLQAPLVKEHAALAQARDFDRAYVEAALALEREQIALWQDVLGTTTDGELTRFAYETQPLLQTGHNHAARTFRRM